jgi:Fe-S-cluster containining protein
MPLNPQQFSIVKARGLSLLDRLGSLFDQMDRTYTVVADQYGFQCSGCANNCCLTRFYHHTLIEYLYIMDGVDTLTADVEAKVKKRAGEVCQKMAAADCRGEALRTMCPLNQDERCILYRHRPMICRLHGIPHELQRPGGSVAHMPGCNAFFDQCRSRGKTDYIRFDRTPLYRQMAMLEKEMRAITGYTKPIKLTVAQMLILHTQGDHEID